MSPPFCKGPLKALRKPKLGPPDIYPQDPNQKEDELNAVHVKQGFTQSYCSLVSDEYGSANARIQSMDLSKITSDFKAILSKKEELNTFGGDNNINTTSSSSSSSSFSSSSSKRRQPLNTKDHFWLVTGKNQKAVEFWFKDLTNQSKSFAQLAKKIPIFNKREEILVTLCKHEVPIIHASWFIKMTAAYNTSMSEANKTKKRQNMTDPSLEWTMTLVRYLKDQLMEISNLINSQGHAPSPAGTLSLPSGDENKPESSLAYKQWSYTLELSEYMYYQGLLDRQEFLQWILELVEKCRYPDEPIMRLILPLVLSYSKEFVSNELLSRKLAYQCAKKISYLVGDTEAIAHGLRECSSTRSTTSTTTEVEGTHPIVSAFLELTSDPYYRFIILGLSSVLQLITTDCPTALIWNYFGENKTPSNLLGSPLDHLPGVSPSALPMPPRANTSNARQLIRQSEMLIKERSAAAEMKWTSGDRGGIKTGSTVSKILSVLEDLDSYVFERMDASNVNCLDSLYNRLFHSEERGEDESRHEEHRDDEDDAIVIHTLCEWAVTSKRSGDHRGFVVAKILERRQGELSYSGNEDVNESDIEFYYFQSQLFSYLDTDAPTLTNKQEFSNLILLYYELITHDVFSHDQYLCILVSRGDLNEKKVEAHQSVVGVKEDGDGSFEDRKINDDLTNLLNQIKVGNQLDDHHPFSSPKDSGTKDLSHSHSHHDDDVTRYSRHWQYCYNLPLPQEESFLHDCNQRYVLLYGAGKGKDDISKNVKKLTKDLLKLFSKKFSIDVSDNGKVKKHSKSDFIFECVVQKFTSLSYYDQHCVVTAVGSTVVEMLSSFSHGVSTNYLPVAEYVSFLFDLTGLALNIQGLLDWCLTILKELPGIENVLLEKSSVLIRQYTTVFALYIVGVLRRYHTIFILNPSDVICAFDAITKIAIKPKIPSSNESSKLLDCNSAEWCLLAYLFDLSINCNILKGREKFSDLRRLFSTATDPSQSTYTLSDRRFGAEYIATPRKKIDSLFSKYLFDSPKNRYNFVCNVLIEVSECNDTDKLNDIAILCCEFTSQINSLSSEWLGALTALCNAGSVNVYADLLTQVSIYDQSIYNRLGIFISILIARHTFQLQSFVISVAIPSLLKAWEIAKEDSGSHGNSTEGEIGARLSCHLLLRLFKTVEPFQPMYYTMGSPQPMPRPSTHASGIKVSSDRHLLSSAHRNITVGAIIAVLKAMIVLGDANSSLTSSLFSTSSGESSDDFGLGLSGLSGRMETANLSEVAKYTLRQICRQQWVHDRCLQDPDNLLKNGTLLDPMLTSQQAQTLLRLICDVSEKEESRSIKHILSGLDEWNLRVKAVDVKLMYHQLYQQMGDDVNDWLDTVSLDILSMFQIKDHENNESNEDGEEPDLKKRRLCIYKYSSKTKYPSLWMIPYLVKNLKFLQKRVLAVSISYLERGNWSRFSRGPSGGLLPFLQLVLTCIREPEIELNSSKKLDKLDKEELKDNLLSSLHTQLSTYLCFTKNEKIYNYEDLTARKRMQDALQLRFSLVGCLFDNILRSQSSIIEWSHLLVQLIARGVVDLTNNSDIFTNVLDMLTQLLHSTLVSDKEPGSSSSSSLGSINGSSSNDETKKASHYHSLVKKLRKEIGDKNSISISYLRQLLPFPKCTVDAILVEPFGIVTDGKGNKIKGLHSDKKIGLQVSDKVKISPWDVLEGHKNPAPLSWTWFATVKQERKPLKYLEAFHELKFASSLEKSKEYFLSAPPLPLEDLEPTTKDSKDENKHSQLNHSLMMSSQRMSSGVSSGSGANLNQSGQMMMNSGPLGQGNQMMMMNMTNGQSGQMNSMMGSHMTHPSANRMMGPNRPMHMMHMMPNNSPRPLPLNQQTHPHMLMHPRGVRSQTMMMMQGGGMNRMMSNNMYSLPPSSQQPQPQPLMNTSGSQWNSGGNSYGGPTQHMSNSYGPQYGQPQIPMGAPRFNGVNPSTGANSKQALQNMLRARHPGPPSQFNGNANAGNQYIPVQQQQQQQQQQQFVRPNMCMQNTSGSLYQGTQMTGATSTNSFNNMNPVSSYGASGNYSLGSQQQQQQYIMRQPGGYSQQMMTRTNNPPSYMTNANSVRNGNFTMPANAGGTQQNNFIAMGPGSNMMMPGSAQQSSNTPQLMAQLQRGQPPMNYPQQSQNMF